MKISKYFHIAITSWENSLVYRLNFVMWRVRNIFQTLTIFFVWLSVASSPGEIHSYTNIQILTYVLVSSFISSIVLSSRSIDAQGEIASGDLNNYLIKPLNYFLNWIARDLSDKALNITFSLIEIATIVWLIKPPVLIQTNLYLLIQFSLSVVLSTILYFLLSFIVSISTFWYYQNGGWAQRFLTYVFLQTLGGTLFPLDMLPKSIFNIFRFLPTTYFLFFPTQIYLGRISTLEIFTGFGVQLFWIIILFILGQHLWRKGLKIYGAYGR